MNTLPLEVQAIVDEYFDNQEILEVETFAAPLRLAKRPTFTQELAPEEELEYKQVA
jgi:hypothetical protein